jgi:DNA-binding transcriptional LysR family regulator
LVVGASPGVSTYALPAMLELFVAGHPGVSVSVRTGHSEEVLEMVLEEEVQVGLTREVSHPEVESEALYEDEMVLVVYPEHGFVGKGSATLEEIGRERLIFFDNASSYYEITRSVFREAGLRELRAMELDNIEAAKRMVERRLGIAFMPRTAVARSVADGRLRTVGVEDGPALHRPIVALKRRDVPPTATVGAFLKIAHGMGERPGGERFSPALAASFESLQLIDLFSS